MRNFVLASSKSWFSLEDLPAPCLEHNWVEISQPAELTPEFVAAVNPEFIFFPHWNARIPSEILERWDCVVFHTAPLPFGRGGSPIQNLIERGFSSSPVHALKAIEEMDAGPIYASQGVDLSGSLEEIFGRIKVAVGFLIGSLLDAPVEPIEQSGEVVTFNRREPSDSQILEDDSVARIYDKIRMVDFEDYPRAYLDFGTLRLIFTKAALGEAGLSAQVQFTEITDSDYQA